MLLRSSRRLAARTACRHRSSWTVETPYLVQPTAMGFEYRPSEVQQALKDGRLRATFTGAGFGNRSLRMELANRPEQVLDLHFERGTLFANDARDEQPLILSDDLPVRLGPGQTEVRERGAFCGVSSFACPSGRHGGMAITPFVLGVPGVMVTQAILWEYLNKFSPAGATPIALSAQYAYAANPGAYHEFHQRCAAMQGLWDEGLEEHEVAGEVGSDGDSSDGSLGEVGVDGDGSGGDCHIGLLAHWAGDLSSAFASLTEFLGSIELDDRAALHSLHTLGHISLG